MFNLYKRAVCNTNCDVYCLSKRQSGKAKPPAGDLIVGRLSVRCPFERIFTVMQCEIRSPNGGNDGSSSAAGQMRLLECPPKKKGESALKQDTSGQGVEDSEHPGSDREALLQREYDKLTDTLNNLKRKVEKLRRENEFLQNEANQTRMESQEYMSYMSKRTQKRQSAIVTLSDQNHQALEALKRQREETLDKYQEQANELKKEILEKENELALLNIEIAELREFKSLQQQQLGRIAELEREVTSMHCRHSESLQALKAGFLSEKERYEAQAKQKIQALALAANREASRCLLSHTRAVSLENQHLREELQQLIQV
ncbi:coiled-coil domain-containing protein 166 isoform X2 [Salvelinus sp. IW2-2015]|uniref:coiled-coil domain-containing protein 166 isoform X2 n=1 Tax=Salvelinus sp. IW2-2015 TaxID=2691554 RepID=UPI0038D4C6B6